ncbi:M81 family metallopeptidase [Paenibacillus dakarensis]|uniref:M81 family metallopeptidase n=1 Tax=Paenibacillus dakarensis TaxID=1527293 RepID=UPI0006D554A1|nr:M81 family metallopeptidase [Paenibacillus dakarensis]
MKSPKILIGSIIQESNTFSCRMSDMDDFRKHSLLYGPDLLEQRTESELQGFIKEARERGAGLVPVMAANAISSGRFSKQGVEELTSILLERLREAAASGVDGVYFALHGAMAAEECDDVEGHLIRMIRSVIGDLPFVISLDLHANITQAMTDNVDGLVGFRTYPHTDFAETGKRAARLLFSILGRESRPVVRMRKIPMIVPAENSQTTYGPFADLWKAADQGEEYGDSLVTSLFPVQPWLDVEELGCTVVTVGWDAERAEAEAERIAELFWQKRHEFDIRLYTMPEIAAMADARRDGDLPMILSDSADSPGAGSSGDSGYVLSELIRLGVPDKHRCLHLVVDPAAVETAVTAGVGSEASFQLGYSLCPDGLQVPLTGVVRRIGDGRFMLGGGYASGTEAFMGRCAVIETGKLSVLVSERPTFSGDPAMYRSMGLMPEEADIVLVKSANQFRAEYEKLSDRIYILDTPGRSPANLKQLNYRAVQRPFYPFDDDFDWRNPR